MSEQSAGPGTCSVPVQIGSTRITARRENAYSAAWDWSDHDGECGALV
jgi:hypothetical protein